MAGRSDWVVVEGSEVAVAKPEVERQRLKAERVEVSTDAALFRGDPLGLAEKPGASPSRR